MANRHHTVSKLLNFKSWVELDEAARHLSAALGEDVQRSDLLRLALEGHFKLSVRFAGAESAMIGKAIPLADVEVRTMPDLTGTGVIVSVNGTAIPGTDQVIVYEDVIASINEVWDLPMFGGERLTVEMEYQRTRDRETMDAFNLEGTFVTDSRGTYCKLMEWFEGKRDLSKPPRHPSHCYPAAFLPESSTLVVRTANLLELADRLAQKSRAAVSPTLGRRERSTLLIIIAALAKMAKVDVGRPSSAAAAIECETERMGSRVAARTIENHLKLISDALDDRGT